VELFLRPHARLTLDVDPAFEHGVLVDTGTVSLADTRLAPADLGYVGPGAPRLALANLTDAPARVMLLGGPPFGEEILMWWNFVGRDHDEIVAFRDAWQRESDRFGHVEGYRGDPRRIPAPPLPNVRIKPRRNPPARPVS
jgi:redox-sensitive bicupin YhaK (pirin superfamily)